MIEKIREKELALELRRKGYSYSEILEKVPVAKSTLSIWLYKVGLSKKQKQSITDKKISARLRGALKRKEQRIDITNEIIKAAVKEVGEISPRELFLLGIALYWAEGSKAKDYRPSQGITFSNSDPKMISVFLKWLIEILKIDNKDLIFEIYIHRTYINQKPLIRSYWAKETGLSLDKFDRIYFKKIGINKIGKNINYHGLLRVKVRKSTNLNRKIVGWIKGIYNNCGIV